MQTMIIKKADIERAKQTSSFTTYDSMLVKGVAIVLLMFHHCISMNQVEKHTMNFFPFESYHWPVMVCDSFKLCVGMFVFITGYGLYKSFSKIDLKNRAVFNWTGTRLFKTLSGFWIVYILVFVVTYLVDKRPLTIYVTGPTKMEGSWIYAIIDFLGLAKIADTPSLIGTWWYMSAVVIMIIFFPLLYAMGEKFSYFITAFAMILLPRIIGQGFPGTKNVFSFVLVFIFGMVFAKHDLFAKLDKFTLFKKSKLLSDIVLFFVYMLAFFMIVYLTDKIGRKYLWEFNYSIAPLIVILFCNRYLKRIPVLNRGLMYIGNHSLNIFLIHTFIRYEYLNDFTYSFKYALLIPFVLLAISFTLSVVVELFKKLIRYDKLVSKVIGKLFSDKNKKPEQS